MANERSPAACDGNLSIASSDENLKEIFHGIRTFKTPVSKTNLLVYFRKFIEKNYSSTCF